MIYKKYENENYNLYTIKTNKFRTCHMEIIFRQKITKEVITKNNLLTDLLTYTSKKYPTRKSVVEHLEDLYSSNFYSMTSRVGNTLFSNFILEFLDPKYCDNNYLKNVISFPFEMILNPNIEDNEFDNKSYKIIRNRNERDIISKKDNPNKYAMTNALKLYDKNSPLSLEGTGYKEDLDSINNEDIVKYYNEFLENNTCDIYIIGNLDMDKVNKFIKESYHNRYYNDIKIPFYLNNKPSNKVINKEETLSCEQSTLLEIYEVKNLTQREKDYTMYLMNSILGNGSLTTKLYTHLREENSLCYNTYSMYQKLDNILIIYVGIDSKNKDKCLKLITKSINEMKKGIFTDEEFNNTKKSLVESMKMSLDNESSIIDNYVFNTCIDTPLINDRIKTIPSITKEEVINVAKKIELKTIYMLKGEQHEED